MRLQQLLQRLPWPRARSRQVVIADPAPRAAESPSGELPRRSALPDRLDLQAALIHHLEWCVLFNEHLAANEERQRQLEPLTDADDSALGLWLREMVVQFGHREPRLLQLREEHRRFHALARQALMLARKNRMDLATPLLNTDFERSRARVLELLRAMQKG